MCDKDPDVMNATTKNYVAIRLLCRPAFHNY